MSIKIAIVTGANKGIGEGIVLHLAKQYKGDQKFLIYLTSRSEDLGKATLEKIRAELGSKYPNSEVDYHQLDVTKQSSIDKLAEYLKAKHGNQCVDILVNNAGWASKGPKVDYEIAKRTIGTNYYGLKNVTFTILPLMKMCGRIINISSTSGKLKILSPELQKKYSDPNLTVEELDKLQDTFINAVKDNTFEQLGYPAQTYGVSKVGVIALTKILARDYRHDPHNLFFAALCPGWIRTDMAGPRATGTIDEGVQTPVYLALTDESRVTSNSGEFWTRKTIDIW
ncbi:hypothetical protein H4219_002635 [Mycoemilia scoparia]|uniref:Carbonyl reductase n=1 Tax=Mycoemilia scoparia TaxID=417184 RepID=A0A9W8DQC3_9FUNG|nr:hypothetical protein H4219_002635 [Mycoemilia scoparia]